MLGGLIPAPFTFRSSLAAMGIAGGFTSGVGKIAECFRNKDRLEGELRNKSKSFSHKTAELWHILNGIMEPLRTLTMILNDMSYESLKESTPNFEHLSEQGMMELLKLGLKSLSKPLKSIITSPQGVDIGRIGPAICAFSKNATFGVEFLKLPAAGMGGSGLAIPEFVVGTPLLDSVLMRPAQGVGTGVFQRIFDVLASGFGVVDILDGVIINGIHLLDRYSVAVHDLHAKEQEIKSILDVFKEATDILANARLI